MPLLTRKKQPTGVVCGDGASYMNLNVQSLPAEQGELRSLKTKENLGVKRFVRIDIVMRV